MIPPFADALFWSAVALCALGQAALLHSFFRGASRPNRAAAASFRATETVWAVVPAAVLVVLLAFTWRVMQAPATLRMRVSAPVAVQPAPAALPAAPALERP